MIRGAGGERLGKDAVKDRVPGEAGLLLGGGDYLSQQSMLIYQTELIFTTINIDIDYQSLGSLYTKLYYQRERLKQPIKHRCTFKTHIKTSKLPQELMKSLYGHCTDNQ